MNTQLHKTFFFKLLCTVVLVLGVSKNSFAATYTVAISSPTSGTTVNAGGTFTFTATLGGGANQVSFYTYIGTTYTLISTDGSSPYSITVTAPTAPGTYTYAARSSNTGNGTVSGYATVSITVVAAPPTVTTNGPVCNETPITLTAADASTTGGTYKFYADAALTDLLQSGTSKTYTSANLTGATNFYVTYTVGGSTSSATTVAATVTAAPTLSSAPTGTGLTFSYPFTGNANDASSAGNNGAIYGGDVTLTSDRFGNSNSAYNFAATNSNGTNGYIYTTAAAAAGPNNFTINLWFNTTTAGGLLIGFGGTQNNGNSSTHDRKIYMSNSGQLIFGIYNGTLGVTDTVCTPSATNYADGNWHMVTGILSSTAGMSLYVDGKEISANAGYTVAQAFSGYWRIGEDNLSGWPSPSTNYYYTGTMDDICVYTSAITPATVFTLYGAGAQACVGAPLTLQANSVSGATYSWTGPNNFSSTAQNPTVDATASATDLGTYVLTVTGTCSYSENVTPQLFAEPTPVFTASSTSVAVAASTAITYSGTLVSGDTYSWDFGGGTPSTGTGSGPFTVSWSTMGAKTITLIETNANGCSAVYTKSVTVGGLNVTAGNYAFSQNVALNTSQITGGITSTLSNFPALVYIQENALIATGNCANNVQFPLGNTATNGYDFAFTMQGSTTELYYQVESYNTTTGALLVWVNVPTVTSTNTALTFYFGSAAPGHTTAFTQAAWASDYAAVYHFDEGALSTTTGYVKDATANAHNATQSSSGVTLGAGEVRTAAGITAATSAYIFKGAGSLTVSGGVNIPSTFTLSAWVNLNATGHDQKVMTNQTASVGGYKLGVYSTNIPESETTGSINRGYTPAAPTIGTSAWHYLQSVFDGTKIVTYVDGGEYQVESTTSGSSNNNPYYIGVGEGGNQYYFYGTISEARVSSLAKSSDWINAEYYNQSNPTTFTIASTTISAVLTGGYAINAQAIGASIPYTWIGGTTDATNAANWTCTGAVTTTGTNTGTLNIEPATDGSASLTIPATTNYPVLPAGSSIFPIYSLTMGSGAQFYLNGNTLYVGCHVYNNGATGGTISSGANSTSTITPTTTGGLTFTGTGALSGQTQYLYGSTTSKVYLANLTESNAVTGGSLNVSGPVSVYSTFGATAGNITIASGSTLTLVSTAAGTANVDILPTGNSITGSVTAQRYIPTGTGYRNYRLLTIPVNISSLTTNQTTTRGYIDLHSLNTGLLTAGPGTGFSYATATTNPLMYLYDESRAQNFQTFIGGKNVGIYSMTGSTTYNVTTYGTTSGATKTTAQVPVGNSVQMYFVGPNTAANLAANPPLAATSSATGYLNQGTIPVYIYNKTTTALSYTSGGNNTATPALVGLNQVGNPYESTIDLDSVYYDNKSTGNIGPSFWELKEPFNTFVAYNGASHTASTTGAEPYIASGQGFYADALSATSTLTFYENEKVNVQMGTSTTPVLILSQKLNNSGSTTTSAAEVLPSGLAGLHLQINKDSATYTQTGIYFNSAWSDKFLRSEDAVDLDGTAPQVYLSSYSSDGMRLCINELSNYTNGKTVKLYASATTSGTYTISLADIKNIDPLYNVYLRDHKLNDSVNVLNNNYTFTINTSDTTTYGANRFDIVFEREALPPYQLLTFTGQKVTTGVQLNWLANNAGNYTGFILQKEDANNNFNQIYTVQSNNTSAYTFVDTNPIVGANVYRLAQNDINGNITYSSLITIGYNNVSSAGYFSVYPNPATSILNVLINATPTTATSYVADIYNTSGVSMDHRVLNTFAWTEDVSNYKEGVYIIVLKDNNGNVLAKTKFIKTK